MFLLGTVVAVQPRRPPPPPPTFPPPRDEECKYAVCAAGEDAASSRRPSSLNASNFYFSPHQKPNLSRFLPDGDDGRDGASCVYKASRVGFFVCLFYFIFFVKFTIILRTHAWGNFRQGAKKKKKKKGFFIRKLKLELNRLFPLIWGTWLKYPLWDQRFSSCVVDYFYLGGA